MVFKASKIKRIIFLSGIFVFLVIFICFLALNHLEKLKFDFKKETKIKLPTVETNSKEEFPNQKNFYQKLLS